MKDNNILRSLGNLEGKMETVLSVVSRLEEAFNQLEAGRLSRLEREFAVLESKLSIKAKNTALIWSTGGSIVASVIIATILHFLKP